MNIKYIQPIGILVTIQRSIKRYIFPPRGRGESGRWLNWGIPPVRVCCCEQFLKIISQHKREKRRFSSYRRPEQIRRRAVSETVRQNSTQFDTFDRCRNFRNNQAFAKTTRGARMEQVSPNTRARSGRRFIAPIYYLEDFHTIVPPDMERGSPFKTHNPQWTIITD